MNKESKRFNVVVDITDELFSAEQRLADIQLTINQLNSYINHVNVQLSHEIGISPLATGPFNFAVKLGSDSFSEEAKAYINQIRNASHKISVLRSEIPTLKSRVKRQRTAILTKVDKIVAGELDDLRVECLRNAHDLAPSITQPQWLGDEDDD